MTERELQTRPGAYGGTGNVLHYTAKCSQGSLIPRRGSNRTAFPGVQREMAGPAQPGKDRPPLTLKICPVIWFESSEARNSASWAMSLGRFIPKGILSSAFLNIL